MATTVEITELLQRVHQGDLQAMDAVMPLVYGELKKLASAHLRREGRDCPLETTALVHEAFLRLAGGNHPSYQNRSHFYAIASRLMRRVLVDSARSRTAAKRSVSKEIQLAELPDIGQQPDQSLLAIDEALERLARDDPRKARLVEMRFFGGMTAEESAEAMSISVHIVRRELRLAQAWLRKEIAE